MGHDQHADRRGVRVVTAGPPPVTRSGGRSRWPPRRRGPRRGPARPPARGCPGRSRAAPRGPRLKTWPGRGAGRPEHVRVSASATAQVVRHRAGSRLPWTARPGPTRRRASSRGTRQSTPTTVLPAVGHRGQQLAGAHPEEDGGDAGVGPASSAKSRRVAGRTSSSVVGGGEDAGPAVEDLDGRGPGVELGAQRGQGQVGEPLHQLVPERGIAVHQRLDPGEVLGRTPLHQVAGHGERARRRSRSAAPSSSLGQHAAPPRPRRACRPRARAGAGAAGPPWPAEGLGHHRPGARGHVHPEADGRRRHHDVGEEDGGVGAVAVDRLAGQLGHQLGLGDGLEDAARARGRPGTREATGRPGA